MLHEPAAQAQKDNSASYKMSLGIRMFLIYAIVYGGFVAINLIKPALMKEQIIFGLNLAVVYGFGLIIFAVVLALIYNRMCTKKELVLNTKNTRKEGE